jgi:hypothetical protein
MTLTRRYALRRLNPFLGVLQVIESDRGRAISTDGVNWEIQLYGERAVGWGSLGTTKQLALYRFGVWSEGEGLARFPSPPTVDRGLAQAAGEVLLEAARATQPLLPLPLCDRYERWLLDASPEQHPIALLAAVSGVEPLALGRAPPWSCALGEGMVMAPGQRSALEAQVRTRAGQAGRSQWFRREADGSGMALAAREAMPGQRSEAYGGRWLDAEAFPELLLREDWEDPGEAAQVADYLAGIAPRLLMLPLRAETRARLEQLAAAEALAVDRFHRLYPRVMDEAWLVRLRVEARLRRGTATPWA